ncbi:MAG: NfeD family protein [Rhodocyclaceae bacterium]|jgi:membrane protein implicated in regulation of membrane protease activity|nr:NfeD family protein [Rhodocyclaceae bacterium]
MSPLWWHWIILGLALAVVELAVPSFFIIWFGLGALVVGLTMLVWPGLELTPQITLWTAASIAFTTLWFTVLRKQGGDTRTGQADEALGEIGVLVSAVEPFQRGEVRFQKPVMGAEVWPCIADTAIAAGARVRVSAVDGQLLKVVAL